MVFDAIAVQLATDGWNISSKKDWIENRSLRYALGRLGKFWWPCAAWRFFRLNMTWSTAEAAFLCRNYYPASGVGCRGSPYQRPWKCQMPTLIPNRSCSWCRSRPLLSQSPWTVLLGMHTEAGSNLVMPIHVAWVGLTLAFHDFRHGAQVRYRGKFL